MNVVNSSHKVSCWRSVTDFIEIKNTIFNPKSTPGDLEKALNILKVWKIRRGQDTPLGILCTIILLEISQKDSSNAIKDRPTLSTLYASALSKFINFATSFKLNRETMYMTASQLGIDSFLIDLRHSFAHGRQTFNLDVYRHSHAVCMKWIKEYYWDKEVENVQDVEIKNIRYNPEMSEKLDEIFTFYDLLSDLIFKNFRTFEELQKSNEMGRERWPLVKQFMKEKNLKNFQQAYKYFTNLLARILAAREMRLNSKTFIHVMLTKCELFMRASEMTGEAVLNDLEDISSDEEAQITPIKKPKKSQNKSIVNLYQNLIWHIAKNDYLKLLIDMLVQVYIDKSETESRRKSAHFWISIILKSYNYYQKYCDYTKSSMIVIASKKIPPEVRNIYSYQLDADLKNVLIFVGTQMLPTSLKYSSENVLQLIETISENGDGLDMCMSFMSLVHPPLTVEQIEMMKELIEVRNDKIRGSKFKVDKIFTVEDLRMTGTIVIEDREKIWKVVDSEMVSWSSLPLGYEFRV